MGAGVNVTVVDDGMHFEHEDLTDNADPSRNRNYSTRASIFNPFETHGTRVAGLIAARDNNIGMRGVAPQATIYGYNLLADSTDCECGGRHVQDRRGVHDGRRGHRRVQQQLGTIRQPLRPQAPASAAWELAVQNGVTSGNHGKGVFYVFLRRQWRDLRPAPTSTDTRTTTPSPPSVPSTTTI